MSVNMSPPRAATPAKARSATEAMATAAKVVTKDPGCPVGAFIIISNKENDHAAARRGRIGPGRVGELALQQAPSRDVRAM